MIRRLKEQDRGMVVAFLSQEPSINLFILGDLEAFGFEEDFQNLWGQFNCDGRLEGVLLRFYDSFISYFTGTDFDITKFLNIILSYKGKLVLSGKEDLIRRFEASLPITSAKSMYFCELNSPDMLSLSEETVNMVKIATEQDAERIHDLIAQIDELDMLSNTVDRIQHTISTKSGRIYYIEDANGTMVSVSQTTAENSSSAMVVGVATLKEARHKGYMSMCLSRLCADVLSEGKALCLFYDNPEAGKVYHRLGFQTIGHWCMLRFYL